jgi:hypothetical protein
MGNENLDLDAFCSWLCEHENEVVGYPGMCLRSPLARWLSDRFGGMYGVDGMYYGRAAYDGQTWQVLPWWAQKFERWAENHALRIMTGRDAFAILAAIVRCWCWLFGNHTRKKSPFKR